jgi:hypothetical protein
MRGDGKSENAAGRLPVPDVIIGGAPRSGTTFLGELLGKHPGVFMARPIIPEPKVCLTPHPEGKSGLLARYATFFSSAPPGSVRVEKTSNYFENDEARERLADLLPDLRLTFILREPVARAYSNWLWSRKNGLETLSFAEAISREGTRVSPLPPERAAARPFDYMIRGRYGTLAERWIEAFGRDRIAFYPFEWAISEPEPFVQHLQRFIGAEPLPWSALETGQINATNPDPAGLDPALAARLREQARPEVERFAAITGVDISVWGY